MADQDDLFYLQPGFELNSLTVPRLRNILVAHDIDYPSSAKKGDLVEIIQSDVLPQAKKLLRARDKVRRTSKGITDVPSSQESVDDEDDRELMPPPPAPKTPRGRKSKSSIANEDVAPTPRSSRRSKTPSNRKSTGRTPRASDTEQEPERVAPSTVKRIRKSTPGHTAEPEAPAVRLQEPSGGRRSMEAGSSPFTQDNPFQSGSSPPSDSKRTSTSRSRKSIGSSTSRKSLGSRRQTRSPSGIKQEDSPPSKSVYKIPVAHISTGRDGVETTEEFTEEASNELANDMRADRKLVKSRNNAVIRHKKQPASKVAKYTPLGILTAIVAATAGWYRQEKVAVGYCHVGEPSWSLAQNPNIPAWMHENLAPECEACPLHAQCLPNMETICDQDYVLQHHPLSLNGLIPIPPTCEPDGERQRRVKAITNRGIETLRELRASHECGIDMSSSASSIAASVAAEASSVVKHESVKAEVSEKELKEKMAKQRRKNMSEQEFEDLFESALEEIKAQDEIVISPDGSLSSSSLAKVPLTCALRINFYRTIRRNKFFILLVIMVIGGGFYGKLRFQQYTAASSQTPQLVAMTLDRLATQAALKEDGRAEEGYIAVGQLRDDVLRHVFSKAERERVWERVRRVVEGNSNVRAGQREGKRSGEWSRVWEWIGPLDSRSIEGTPQGLIRGSAVVTPESNGREAEGREMRKWDEGRAIY